MVQAVPSLSKIQNFSQKLSIIALNSNTVKLSSFSIKHLGFSNFQTKETISDPHFYEYAIAGRKERNGIFGVELRKFYHIQNILTFNTNVIPTKTNYIQSFSELSQVKGSETGVLKIEDTANRKSEKFLSHEYHRRC